MSHQAEPNPEGMTLLQAVRQGTELGAEPGEVIDPATHTATITASISGQIEELRATLTQEQASSLRRQREAVVAEMTLLETLLQERERELQMLDEALLGLPPTPAKAKHGRAKAKAGKGKGGQRAVSPSRRSSAPKGGGSASSHATGGGHNHNAGGGKRKGKSRPKQQQQQQQPAVVLPKLTLPNKEARTALFREIDVNSNGGLSLAEIDKAVVSGQIGRAMNCPDFDHKPALMRAYKAADTSGDEFIERREFLRLLQ
jgi:hypothetical protein